MTSYIDSRIITLNSQYGIKQNTTYNSNVFFNMSGVLKDEHDIIEADIVLLNAQIPVSFYNLNYTCNILNYRINSTNKTITFIRGNYNINTFIKELQTQFTNLGDTINISLNQTTGFLTFTGTANFTFLGTSTMFRILGFYDGVDYSSTSNVLNPPHTFNLSTITQLNISSDNLITHSFSSINVSNILYTISVDKPPFSILIYNCANNNTRVILRNSSVDAINIKIKDEYGSFINFNNQDWNLTFSINIKRRYLEIPRYAFSEILKNQTPKEPPQLQEEPPQPPPPPEDEELKLLSQ
jgi:hypothetical protein